MRIDKFLKDARLIKRRTIAKEMCDAGKIMLNDKVVKAGTAVKVDDVIQIEYAKMIFSVKILTLEISTHKTLAASCYEELSKVAKS